MSFPVLDKMQSMRYFYLNLLVEACHTASYNAGWWNVEHPLDKSLGKIDAVPQVQGRTRFGIALVNEKLALSHSELSEALEGYRKDRQDDHLPHLKSIDVELADAVIRICDLAGALKIDLGRALVEKMAYNAIRPDHKVENREAAGGKSC